MSVAENGIFEVGKGINPVIGTVCGRLPKYF